MTYRDVYLVTLGNADVQFRMFFDKNLPIGTNARMRALNYAISRALMFRALARDYAAKNGVSI
jgi:hypothetical protein